MPDVAFVTGAAGGIGHAIVEQLVLAGWAVVAGDIVYDTEQPLAEVSTPSVTAVGLDVRFPESIDAAMAASAALGELRGVVNCAGILRSTTIDAMRDEDMMEMFLVNLASVARVCRAASPYLAEGAAIVNIGSIAGASGFEGTSIYAATKAGMEGFTRVLARELAPRGIRANVIAPGYIRVPMSEAMKRVAGGGEDTAASRVPMGRLGEAEEVAQLVEFLLSERSSYITGTVITVDGGATVP